MSENKNDSFFAEEYEEAPETIRFVDEEVAGIADIIPERAARPDALPNQKNTYRKKLKDGTPARQERKNAKDRRQNCPSPSSDLVSES